MTVERVRVRVPATTANLGPGFDSLGLALGLYNEVELALAEQTSVVITGEGAESLPHDDSHLLLLSAQRLADRADFRVNQDARGDEQHAALNRCFCKRDNNSHLISKCAVHSNLQRACRFCVQCGVLA